MGIEYIGEHLLPGKLGNFFIALSFVAALFAAISYALANGRDAIDQSWKRLGRIGFLTHGFAVFGVIGTIFYMLVNHMFEYQYIWQHSNTEMPMRYILSAFWEGQEGSFLLWSFWHVILGLILMLTAKHWEAGVMSVFSLVQVFLASMLLGTIIFGYKLGSNPFLLLREHTDYANLPFVQNPNYLAKLDGRGLNPLLQNYWMTIHPPTLFLGFASTLVPFAYGIAALWNKKFNEWLKPALPWTFFGIMILGTGILMGGAWAYEALSFGGFWAWDPVENASLVPWLTFVGAGHVMLINKNKGQSLFVTFGLTFLTFILVLYSTFLTRSGVLGDTSVHAFTDLGMSGQLLVYLLAFVVLSTVLLVANWKHFPRSKEDESIWSREFWMFVGAIVLLGSAFQITFTTSIPVINKVFGSNLAPPIDAIEHYNSWQLPFAIIVAILIAVGQFFKYKKTDPGKFMKSISISLGVSVVLAGIFSFSVGMANFLYFLMMFATMFAVTANTSYFVQILKGKIRLAGPSIAHVGFGLLLMGALISTSMSKIISQNSSGVDLEKLGEDFPNQENIMLKLNDTLQMGDYHVVYKGKEKEGVNIYYQVDYLSKAENGSFNPEFTLKPFVQTNPRMGNVAEPSTRHFLHKDIYTHITYADLEDRVGEKDEEYREAKQIDMHIGDTIWASSSYIVLEGVNKDVDRAQHQLQEKDMAFGLRFKVIDRKDKVYYAEPLYVLRDVYAIPKEDIIEELGLKIAIESIEPEKGKFTLKVAEKNKNFEEFVIMKAIVFPFINILWAGCLIMVIGTIIAIRQRLKKS